jgi:alkylhydroperoxidase/carboxymuconolactone decarboxylase family protein YurZ
VAVDDHVTTARISAVVAAIVADPIAALITHGDLEAQLRTHTRWALDHGATPAELDALATLLAIYNGFARASHGLMIIRDALSKLDPS